MQLNFTTYRIILHDRVPIVYSLCSGLLFSPHHNSHYTQSKASAMDDNYNNTSIKINLKIARVSRDGRMKKYANKSQ